MGLTTRIVKGERASRVALVLHGLGADENDLAVLAEHLDPEGHYISIFPRGPYSAGPGYAWFQFTDSLGLMSAQTLSSIEGLQEVLTETCTNYGMKEDEAVIGGFSQGGAVAFAMAYRTSDHVHPAGVVVLSGFLPPDDKFTYDWGNQSLPAAFVGHGTHDPLVQIPRGRQLAETLAEKNVPLMFREYPMEHQLAMEEFQDVKAWSDEIRAGKRPNEPLPEPADEGPVKSVSSLAFDAEVLKSDLPVIVDFWAPWCQPCKMVQPIVEQIAVMRSNYKVVKVNIDQAPEIAKRYEVQSIPLVALFRNGHLERKSLGVKSRQQLEAELGMLVIP